MRAGRLACAALLLAGGCAPANGTAQPLPAPQVRIVARATTGSTSEALQLTPTVPVSGATDTPDAGPDTGVAALAESVYGSRLVRSILIPAIRVSSAVVPVGWRIVNRPGAAFSDGEWDSPAADVGWAISSALPDEPGGNILMYGHNNMYASVFKDLGSLVPGDNIFLSNAEHTWQYTVAQVRILPVLEASDSQRAAYLAYLQPSVSPRLTLISCWPPVSNTYRVVVIADPAAAQP